MVKRKNYDSPFDKEEHNSFELENIFDSESLQNTEFTDEFYDYLPSQMMPSYPTHLWNSSFLASSSDKESDEESEAYKQFKDIEGLE
jgi:hypothetical protein